MPVERSLEEILNTPVLLTLNDSAIPFINRLGLPAQDESDLTVLSGIISDVTSYGVFFNHYAQGRVAAEKALQEFHEQKITIDEYWENHMERMFFPWNSVVAIS